VTAALLRFVLGAGIEAAIGAGSVPKGRNMTTEHTNRIRELNDAFRTSLTGVHVFFTAGMSEKGPAFCTVALATVRNFSAFSADNDPHEEHDFGSFAQGRDRILWKIDYYDLALEFGSEDAADPAQTRRVMTIMLAQEY